MDSNEEQEESSKKENYSDLKNERWMEALASG